MDKIKGNVLGAASCGLKQPQLSPATSGDAPRDAVGSEPTFPTPPRPCSWGRCWWDPPLRTGPSPSSPPRRRQTSPTGCSSRLPAKAVLSARGSLAGPTTSRASSSTTGVRPRLPGGLEVPSREAGSRRLAFGVLQGLFQCRCNPAAAAGTRLHQRCFQLQRPLCLGRGVPGSRSAMGHPAF